jgi:hypothetical protein
MITYPPGTTPTLPVSQSDTFEIQRQKINNLAAASPFVFLAQPVYILKIEQSETPVPFNWFPSGTDAGISLSGTKTTMPSSGSWTTFSLIGSSIPSIVNGVIIEASSNTEWGDGSRTDPFYLFVRQNSSATNSYPILRTGVGYGGNAGQVAYSQGFYPVGTSQTLDWAPYYLSQSPTEGCYIRIIGYY